MPNTSSAVLESATGYALGAHCTKEDADIVHLMFGAVGTAYPLDEEQLDAVTGVSGSGPAYFYYMVECLVKAGVDMGLDEPTAAALVRQTLFGAAAMLRFSSDSPAALRERVTSPNGTTVAGLGVLSERGFEEAVREAVRRGFRVTTNTTLFDGADPNSVRAFFDEVMSFGVEGIVLSPGYTYDKAPDQKHFMGRARSRRLFRAILSNRKRNWKFNMSPLFLEFLMGKRDYQCTPWGSPAYNIFGWQKPCYLLQDGYADTFEELLKTTDWKNYGTESGNPKCANCMVSCGYEPSTVNHAFGTLPGFLGMVKATLFSRYHDREARELLQQEVRPVHSFNPLVQIETAPAEHMEGQHA
jgi:hypothetical protein